MAILFNYNILILFIISIGLVSVSSDKQDGLCSEIRNVLCVKDVLWDILSATEEINNIAQEIEHSIYKLVINRNTFDNYTNHEIKKIQSNLASKYHHQFMNVDNNINRANLINMIQEQNYAFSYLYNSIQNIIKIESPNDSSINKSFNKTLNNLRKNILCNYRNILYVYSGTWLSIDEINGIQIMKTHKRTVTSFLYYSYSITVTRLLQEWTKNVDEFVVNIKNKV